MRRNAAILLAMMATLGGCATQPAPSIVHAHGDLLEVTNRPNDAACDVRLRPEIAAAQRIRIDLASALLPSDSAAVQAAAADSTASTELLGIPLTTVEGNMLRASGIDLGREVAAALWVNVGAPERFGGIWIDPPGTNHYVIAIVEGDPDMIGLARCLERVDTRYVWANISLADGRALADRIGSDMQAMRASGIEVNTVGYRENEGTVVVGVTRITPGLERLFLDRYGGPLRLEEQLPAVPLGDDTAAMA